ncbi:phosphoadenylyl-sulfate reductase [Brevibacillus dissolubilis]|uniref:phosphoadenylyl-sulfate reductase n=1 Tax=Brevibacillus dissolubilis TaxID=1844116 RepID=UPI00111679E0|nr:phosphoadenylyl-sulfate reductase [Brevibacillus dissolubilis]
MTITSNKWSAEQLQEVAARLRDEHPIEIIRWGVENIDLNSFTLACSFGFEDVALVHMLQEVNQDVEIFYLDTSLLFKETYEVRDALSLKYGKTFTRVATPVTLEEQIQEHGDELWASRPDECCRIRKVQPLRQHLQNYEGWITGIRRDQAPTRANTEVVEWDNAFGLVKLNPLAFWNADQVWEYIRQNNIPYNPLHDQHYPSIGCAPCTRQVMPGEDPRAGRWANFQKTECGLHNSPVKR